MSDNAEFQRSSNDEDAESEQHEENEADLPERKPLLDDSKYAMVFRSLEYILMLTGLIDCLAMLAFLISVPGSLKPTLPIHAQIL